MKEQDAHQAQPSEEGTPLTLETLDEAVNDLRQRTYLLESWARTVEYWADRLPMMENNKTPLFPQAPGSTLVENKKEWEEEPVAKQTTEEEAVLLSLHGEPTKAWWIEKCPHCGRHMKLHFALEVSAKGEA